jgi:hypothetical protein
MANEQSSGERVGTFAAGVLESLYTVVYGEPPVGVRAWTEGGALMLLLRLAGPPPFGGFQPDQPEHPGMLPYAAVPELVVAAVRVQTGCELGIGSFSVEAELGLVMFVFRLPFEPPAAWQLPERGEWSPELAPEWESAGVPPWSDLAPIGGTGGGEGERDHLRLVEDDREPGSIQR